MLNGPAPSGSPGTSRRVVGVACPRRSPDRAAPASPDRCDGLADECVRPKASLGAMARLAPSFQQENSTVTAGNSLAMTRWPWNVLREPMVTRTSSARVTAPSVGRTPGSDRQLS
ncbi:hypothetical protein C5746_39000 [Streptomyces atratus]|uniref:Uncharacterized protein n=1 Tax=Streptomyces atratus TaxID=1893 RepID=A0A2Z5JNU6_STRAR|nr:hypothetical protein C5746_39000 [Streptomyces atratus]